VNELALFAGAGGGILGGKLLGWKTVCAVERDAYAALVLAQRQADSILPIFPIWSDVCTFDGRPWRGLVDVVSGGFPCQDISSAGKGAGLDGARSGMWFEMARIVCEVAPRFVFVENSPMLTSRGLGRVLGDLASMGYDAKWCVLGANDLGAPHQRDRIWIVANADTKERKEPSERQAGSCSSIGVIPDALRKRCDEVECNDEGGANCEGSASQVGQSFIDARKSSWWATEPDVGRMVDGVAFRVDRLKAIGNGQVSIVAAAAWKILTQDLK
jgi:DNA (cytosine-5)-methyltransferase 1